MSDTIRLKRRTSGASGAPSTLANAEVAYNEMDDTLYYGKGTGGTGGSATTIIPIAGPGAFVDRTSAQTIAGIKTYSVSPQVPTASAGDSTTNAASTGFVTQAIAAQAAIVVAQAPNTVQAGPASGSTNGNPSYRLLVVADIPTLTSVKISDFSAAADARISLQKGVANGLATLDATGILPSSQLPVAVRNPMSYAGTWNASTNTPTLTSGTGTKGFVYKVTTAGSTNLDGLTQWNVGDSAVFDGTTWDKWDGVSTEVLSVNGQTGAVVLTTDSVSEGSTNLYHTSARVLSTLLAGLSTATNAVVTATDSVLGAIGKLQAQVTARLIASNNLSDLTVPATARTNLGLGTMATQNASAVVITGGTIDNVTLDGGTF